MRCIPQCDPHSQTPARAQLRRPLTRPARCVLPRDARHVKRTCLEICRMRDVALSGHSSRATNAARRVRSASRRVGTARGAQGAPLSPCVVAQQCRPQPLAGKPHERCKALHSGAPVRVSQAAPAGRIVAGIRMSRARQQSAAAAGYGRFSAAAEDAPSRATENKKGSCRLLRGRPVAFGDAYHRSHSVHSFQDIDSIARVAPSCSCARRMRSVLRHPKPFAQLPRHLACWANSTNRFEGARSTCETLHASEVLVHKQLHRRQDHSVGATRQRGNMRGLPLGRPQYWDHAFYEYADARVLFVRGDCVFLLILGSRFGDHVCGGANLFVHVFNKMV